MKNRLDHLDSIRGIAALIVFISHWLKPFDVSFEHFDLGRIGVTIFFIVSGFVIPWSLSTKSDHALRDFAIKRFFRLFPPFWFSILFALFFVSVFKDFSWYERGIKVESLVQVLLNFTMIQKVFGVEDLIGVYWTLFIEMFFYGLCMILFAVSALHNKKIQATLVILFSFLALFGAVIKYLYLIKLPIILPLSMAFMFYGAILKSALVDKSVSLKFSFITLLGLVVILYFITLFNYQEGWFKWFCTYLISFVSCILLLTIFKVTSRVFVYFGKISYSFYLLHVVFIVLSIGFFGELANTGTDWLFVIALSFVLTTLFSDLSFRFVEKPSTRMSKGVLLKLNERRLFKKRPS